MSDTNVASARDIMTPEERDAIIAEVDAADEVARAAECGIPDCDGYMHEGGVPLAEGYHRVYTRNLDGLEVEINKRPDGSFCGWVAIDYIDDADATELRNTAALIARYAGELIEAAERLDSLNKVAA